PPVGKRRCDDLSWLLFGRVEWPCLALWHVVELEFWTRKKCRCGAKSPRVLGADEPPGAVAPRTDFEQVPAGEPEQVTIARRVGVPVLLPVAEVTKVPG